MVLTITEFDNGWTLTGTTPTEEISEIFITPESVVAEICNIMDINVTITVNENDRH
ncbi:MAG: hypothetical protein ACWGNI_00210 [Desulfobacterales bacterium]